MAHADVLLARLPELQAFLSERRLDGWLLYDFKGQNPTALTALDLHGHMLTRRWFFLVPRVGEPTLLVHAIEAGSFPREHIPGARVLAYAGWQQLEAHLGELLGALSPLDGRRRVAMEYCPRGAIPYLSRVDAGTVELVRERGVEVVSSADLVQFFLCRWSGEQLASHVRAATAVNAAKDEAFRFIGERIRAGRPALEIEVQDVIMQAFARGGLVTDHPPIVAVGPHAGDPHYVPSMERPTRCGAGELVLIDLWAKEDAPLAVFADITWVGTAGAPTDEQTRVFALVAAARDAGLDTIARAHAEGRRVAGWEVDRVVRDHIAAAGHGEHFIHRTGHSIGHAILHGDGANLDDFETHDTRELVPGLGFSIEPGVYLPHFGVRSEIDVYLGADGPHVYTPIQRELVRIVE